MGSPASKWLNQDSTAASVPCILDLGHPWSWGQVLYECPDRESFLPRPGLQCGWSPVVLGLGVPPLRHLPSSLDTLSSVSLSK
jgi:hypothetical protein